jgi:1-acyl-sn-glycerol-3-phosphate acyltransferase
MKTLLRIFFSAYASMVFMFWIIVAFFVYLITSLLYRRSKDRAYLKFFYHYIGGAIAGFCFLRVTCIVHAPIDINESYVIVSNHQTMMDIPANVSGAPRELLFKFLGKQEADRVPFFGYLINRLFILVDRKSESSRKNSFLKMKQEMDNGYSILIYPEGTRNRTSAPLKEFYDGAFKLAIEMQKPILVNTLVGIKILNPPTHFFTYFPGKVESHWDKAIDTKGMTLEDLPGLKKQVANLMIYRLS